MPEAFFTPIKQASLTGSDNFIPLKNFLEQQERIVRMFAVWCRFISYTGGLKRIVRVRRYGNTHPQDHRGEEEEERKDPGNKLTSTTIDRRVERRRRRRRLFMYMRA